jgi:26S proteasome regulatory subunit N2
MQPSAAPFIANIHEKEVMLQTHALKNLVKIVDHTWHEIADSLSRIQELAEDNSFPERPLANFLASKVYYFLENFNNSMWCALNSGDNFNLKERSQYVEKLINVCIDEYSSFKKNNASQEKSGNAAEPVPPKLEAVIDKMFTKCFNDRRYKDVIGIAIECRRLDKVKEAIELSGDSMEENLGYTFTIA